MITWSGTHSSSSPDSWKTNLWATIQRPGPFYHDRRRYFNGVIDHRAKPFCNSKKYETSESHVQGKKPESFLEGLYFRFFKETRILESPWHYFKVYRWENSQLVKWQAPFFVG